MMAAVLQFNNSRDREDAPATRSVSPGPLVLVVEDHEDTRFLLRYMLESRGYRVAEAGDGEQAVELAESTRPDLILMDGSLPRLDGLGAARRMRALPSLSSAPIIFLSGHAEPAFRAVALAAGCDEYLTKPVGVDQLERVLARYVAPGGSAEV